MNFMKKMKTPVYFFFLRSYYKYSNEHTLECAYAFYVITKEKINTYPPLFNLEESACMPYGQHLALHFFSGSSFAISSALLSLTSL